MKKLFLVQILLSLTISLFAQADKVRVEKRADGWRLLVNGEAIMVNGMNWDYFPIGTNYSYSLWEQPDDFIKSIQPKWITYIYEKYGIYTMLNHSFGRYGLTLEGAWVANTEYSDPRTRDLLLKEVRELADDYKDTPGLLLYLLGNENNYGLFWGGAETEDIPIEDRKSTQRARHMYTLFNEAAIAMKEIDAGHPVSLCNGDLLFMDIIAEECQDVDIFGINVSSLVRMLSTHSPMRRHRKSRLYIMLLIGKKFTKMLPVLVEMAIPLVVLLFSSAMVGGSLAKQKIWTCTTTMPPGKMVATDSTICPAKTI